MYKLIIFDFSKTLAYPGKTDLEGIFSRMKDYGIDIKDEKQAQKFLDRVFSLFSEVDSWAEFTDRAVEFSAVDISKEKKGELGKYLQKK